MRSQDSTFFHMFCGQAPASVRHHASFSEYMLAIFGSTPLALLCEQHASHVAPIPGDESLAYTCWFFNVIRLLD